LSRTRSALNQVRAAERAVQVGDAEGEVEGLAAVEPGVACGLVPLAQVGSGDVVAAADARAIRPTFTTGTLAV
jgi:hypothetical protein